MCSCCAVCSAHRCSWCVFIVCARLEVHPLLLLSRRTNILYIQQYNIQQYAYDNNNSPRYVLQSPIRVVDQSLRICANLESETPNNTSPHAKYLYIFSTFRPEIISLYARVSYTRRMQDQVA